MADSGQGARGWLVLSPGERLVAGGPAEELEQLVQRLFREGHRHLVLDMQRVIDLDSAGIRALVRGHTTAQRAAGGFRLVGLTPHIRETLRLSRLDSVLSVYESLDEARRHPWPWRDVGLFAAAAAVGIGLVLLGWQQSMLSAPVSNGVLPPQQLPIGNSAFPAAGFAHALTQLMALVAAGLIGSIVTAIHKRQLRDHPMNRSMEQAQILLCVSGAMMMIIIGDSLARAFGIAGAAGIIRFRTPVEDPKDVTILFLSMGLGMACGMGAFGVAGLGTMFLCVALVVLDRAVATRPRAMLVEIVASGREFPVAHVVGIFAQHGVVAEAREVALEDDATITYHTTLPITASIEDINTGLVGDGTHRVKSVAWEPPKKNG